MLYKTMCISYHPHSLEWPEISCCKLPMWLNPVSCPRSLMLWMFSKPRIENKHQEGKKVSFISLKHPHFWEPQRIGKVSSGQWNIWKQHSLLLQEWLRGTHQEGSCGPGPLLPLYPGCGFCSIVKEKKVPESLPNSKKVMEVSQGRAGAAARRLNNSTTRGKTRTPTIRCCTFLYQ